MESTARRLAHTTRRLPSGAGHDAQMLARVCPTAMIFTPSVGGLSHNIAEFTEPADVAAGADVLLQMLLELALAGDGSAADAADDPPLPADQRLQLATLREALALGRRNRSLSFNFVALLAGRARSGTP